MSLLDKAKGLLGVGPVNLPEAAPAPEEKPIYMTPGKEGEANSRVRRIVAFVKLPDRRDVPLADRYAILEDDMREAMAYGARQVLNKAASRSTGGWTWSTDDIEYAFASLDKRVAPSRTDVTLKRETNPTLIVSLVIRRPA